MDWTNFVQSSLKFHLLWVALYLDHPVSVCYNKKKLTRLGNSNVLRLPAYDNLKWSVTEGSWTQALPSPSFHLLNYPWRRASVGWGGGGVFYLGGDVVPLFEVLDIEVFKLLVFRNLKIFNINKGNCITWFSV